MDGAAWLTMPMSLTGSRDFMCMDMMFTDEQCAWYTQRWHFWYIADLVYALPTVYFFLSAIGLFMIGHFFSSVVLGTRRFRAPRLLQKALAITRYATYRGYRVRILGWNTAPLGLLLLGGAGAAFFFCMDLIPQPYYWPSKETYGDSPPLGTRSGWMALACMPFVFATATKANWITLLTGISHEKLQTVHRWTAYAFFLLSLMHTFPFIVYHIHFGDMMEQITMEMTLFYWTGIVAVVFQAWLTFASFSTIRNLGYEFFKAAHFSAVVVFVVALFWHCDWTLTSWHYFIATACIYVPCFIYPWVRVAFEYGFGKKANVFVEENGFIRVNIPANFRWKPSQHCFLRFPTLGLQGFTSHPFTICSLPSGPLSSQSELAFYICQRGGLTKMLHARGTQEPGAAVPVIVDGPYGGINMQKYYNSDHLLVIAGGSGAGWSLPFIEAFIRAGAMQTDGQETETESKAQGPTSLRVILATRDASTRTWFLRTVGDLLSRYPRSSSAANLQIQVYMTGDFAAASTDETSLNGNPRLMSADSTSTVSPASSSEKLGIDEKKVNVGRQRVKGIVSGDDFFGRPQLTSVVREESTRASEADAALGVFICGPTPMQNEVRNAVAAENLKIVKGARRGEVYLHSEHFSWA